MHEEGMCFARTCFAMYKVLSVLRLVFTVILLSAIGMAIGVYLRGYTEQRWIEFISDDRSFAALFPQPPAHEVEPAPPPFENSEVHLFTANTPQGSFQVTCLDSPIELKTAEAILLTDAVARLGGTLEMSGRPGDFLLLMGDGSVVYGRVLRAYAFERLTTLLHVSRAVGETDGALALRYTEQAVQLGEEATLTSLPREASSLFTARR